MLGNKKQYAIPDDENDAGQYEFDNNNEEMQDNYSDEDNQQLNYQRAEVEEIDGEEDDLENEDQNAVDDGEVYQHDEMQQDDQLKFYAQQNQYGNNKVGKTGLVQTTGLTYNENGFQIGAPVNLQTNQGTAGTRKFRPQSAKTGAQVQPQSWIPQSQGGNAQMQPNSQLGAGYSNQELLSNGQKISFQQNSNVGNFFYQHGNQLPPKQIIVGRRRPGTAGRKSKHQVGKISLGGGVTVYGNNGQTPLLPLNAKTVAIEQEVVKLRPRVVLQERERLYDDVMKQRMAANNLRDENIKLKTRLHMTENELARKDKMIDELLQLQQEVQASSGMPNKYGPRSKIDTHHLVVNLKRKVRDQLMELNTKRDEVELLKRNLKNTRTHETEIEIKMYMDECLRLRASLEEVIKSKDTFADPQELKIIEQKFQQRDQIIRELQQEINVLVAQKNELTATNKQVIDLLEEYNKKFKKNEAKEKGLSKSKQALKENEIEIHKMRKEIIELRDQLKNMTTKNQELKESLLNMQKEKNKDRISSAAAPPPATKDISQSQTALNSQEIKKLQAQLEEQQNLHNRDLEKIAKLKQELSGRVEELAITQKDLIRFKELSERYMNEIALMQTQQSDSAVDVKKTRAAQRPKDTVKREQSATNNNNAVKVERVDVKKLNDIRFILKLKLQEQELPISAIAQLFFSNVDEALDEVSIAELKVQFELLGVKPQKSLLLARYIIEPKTGGDVVLNEQATCPKKQVIDVLSDFIGKYKIYSESQQGSDFVYDSKMKVIAVEALMKHRKSLSDALASEDYEETGIIDLNQVREAITSVCEDDIDDNLLDWLLFFVYSRSEHIDRMEYRVLINMLDEQAKQERISSAKPQQRPESSKNEQVQQNIQQEKPKQIEAQTKEEDDYEEEKYSSDHQVDEDNDLQDINNLLPRKKSEDYEESPRPKTDLQKELDSENRLDERSDDEPEQRSEVNEDEMIDVAEKIFVRIAEEIIKNKVSVRMVWNQHLFPAEIDGEEYELLSPEGLIDGIRDLGIDDLNDKEIQYLLKVLSKPELEGAILMQEFLQIMENFGLYDEDEQSPSQDQRKSEQSGTPDQESQPNARKKSEKPLDLGLLDQKSVKIMVMLMLFLLENNMTTIQFFEPAIYQQNVKAKNKQITLDVIKTDDFFTLLKERGIRKKDKEHTNLKDFLQLSPSFPDILLIKNIRKTLEQMAENEDFMEAIREDIEAANQEEYANQ